MGDLYNDNRPANWLESDAIIEMMNQEAQHIASTKDDDEDAEIVKIDVDASHVTQFPVFARRKEKVHVALKQKHRLYDLTRDEIRSHYNEDGVLLVPFEDLSQQNLVAFDNFGVLPLNIDQSVMNNRVHERTEDRKVINLTDLFDKNEASRPTEEQVYHTIKTQTGSHNGDPSVVTGIVGVDNSIQESLHLSQRTIGQSSNSNGGSRNLLTSGLKKGMNFLMNNTAAARKNGGRSRMDTVRSVSHIYISDVDDTQYDKSDGQRYTRQATEMRLESILQANANIANVNNPVAAAPKQARESALLSLFNNTPNAPSATSPTSSNSAKLGLGSPPPGDKATSARARAGSSQAEQIKQHEHGKKLLRLASLVEKHEEEFKKDEHQHWTGDEHGGHWEHGEEGDHQVQDVPFVGIPGNTNSNSPRLTKRHVQGVHRLPYLQGSRYKDDLDLIILSELSTIALVRHVLVVLSRTGGKGYTSQELDEIELLMTKLITQDQTEVDTQAHKTGIETLVAALHTDQRKGQSYKSPQLLEKRGIGQNYLTLPISSFWLWAWVKYNFLGFASVFWLFVIAGVSAYIYKGVFLDKIVLFDVFFMVTTALQLNTMSFCVQWSYSAFNRLPSTLLPPFSKIVREGVPQTIDTINLALGDVVTLRKGDTVPADCRIFTSSDNQCCSMKPLSGDDRYIVKSANWTDENVFYSQNMLLAGSVITRGSCRAVVIRIGDSSVAGKCYIDSDQLHMESQAPVLDKNGNVVEKLTILDELHSFFMYSTFFSVGCALFFFIHGQRWFSADDAILNTYTVSFSNAPEGMIAAVLGCMLLATRKLKRRGIVVKRLEVVENLALSNVLIIDKTGTFTANAPIVTFVLLPSKQMVWCGSVSEAEYNAIAYLEAELMSKRVNLSNSNSEDSLSNMTSLQSSNYIGSSFQEPILDQKFLYIPSMPVVPCAQQLFLSALLCVPENNKHPNFNPEAKLGTVDSALLGWCVGQTIVRKKGKIMVDLVGDHSDTQFYRKTPVSGGTSIKDVFLNLNARSLSPANISSSPTAAELESRYTDTNTTFRLTSPQEAVTSILAAYERILHLPYSMRDKISFSICKRDQICFAVMKGSIEQILDICTYTVTPDRVEVIRFDTKWKECVDGVKRCRNNVHIMTNEYKSRVVQEMEYLCTTGASILAFAYMDLSHYPDDFVFQSHPVNFQMKNVIFTGLISYIDIPRPETSNSMQVLFKNNIQIMMMTADHPISAEAQAKKGGMFPEDTKVLHMAEFSTIKPEDMKNHCVVVNAENWTGFSTKLWKKLTLARAVVFSRVSPQLKGEIIFIMRTHLRRIVSVTGSNIHDAEALKNADAGITFSTASAVAKEYGDVVVMTNELSDIVSSLELSRIFDQNWRKAIIYSTQKMLPELVGSTLCLCCMNIPSPATTMLLMLIDLFLDVLPATSLIYEKKEPMAQERPEGRVINFKMLFFCYLQYGFFMSAGLLLSYLMQFQNYGIVWEDLYQKGHIYIQDNDYLGFTLDERMQIYREAKGAVLLGFVVQQMCTVFARRRRVAPAMRWFKPMDLFDNYYLDCSIVISLSLLSLIIYNDDLNMFFDIQTPSADAWLWPLIPGGFCFILVE